MVRERGDWHGSSGLTEHEARKAYRYAREANVDAVLLERGKVVAEYRQQAKERA